MLSILGAHMGRTIWDHSFKTIGDNNALSAEFIRAKLKQLSDLRRFLIERGDEDSVSKLYIEAHLERCLDKFEGGRPISDDRYAEYYEYAANGAIALDEILSRKYRDLDY